LGKSNLVLIGMPGAGKSTVGVILAKRLGFDFIDTDVLIQAKRRRRLQDIIDREGLAAFRRIEEETLLALRTKRTVVATGGSAVYSEAGMRALGENGLVVFIDVPLRELEKRIRDMDTRGMVIDPGETLADLHRRRLPLYRRWADRTVGWREETMEEVAARISDLATCLDFDPFREDNIY
jgi:shikimate kinase